MDNLFYMQKTMLMLRTHNCWQLTEKNIDEEIKLCGWVNSIRDHGGVIFIDLRDRFWITQVKADPDTVDQKVLEQTHKIKDEFVLQVVWTTKARPEWTQNPNIKTGDVELIPESIKILSKSDILPFQIDDEKHVWEEIRMKHRYLDLRRQSMQDNIIARHKMTNYIFNFLVNKDFLYIETPALVKNTPEWAREYIVPSRHNPWHAYVLPQSPQQLKQMLMLSGFDRYFQIAKCFRDEDLRGDRQPEFTQIDMELSFVEQDDIIQIMNELFVSLTKELFPWKKFDKNIPIITWEQSMNKYWVDNPELRVKDLELIDISDIAKESDLKVFGDVVNSGGSIKSLVINKTFPRSQIDKYTSLLQEKWAKWLAYIVYEESWPKSPILKFFSESLQKQLFERLELKPWMTAFFQATDWLSCTEYLWYLRKNLITDLDLTSWKNDELAFTWVVDFPMFVIDEETWKLNAKHHPFTKPKGEFLPLIKELWQKVEKWDKLSSQDIDKLLNVKADAYDLVLNWNEVAGWSVRMHDQELQKYIFYLIWLDDEQIQQRFSHMLKAFQYGTPPHAWIAIWFDRAVMIYQNTDNIREVIPFPKTQRWEDLMLQTPSEIDPKLLNELWLKLKNINKK